MTAKNVLIFKGGFEELKKRLTNIEGSWGSEKSGAIQFRPKRGGAVTWHIHSGKIQIQGRTTLIPELRRLIEESLQDGGSNTPPKDAISIRYVAGEEGVIEKTKSLRVALSAAIAATANEPLGKVHSPHVFAASTATAPDNNVIEKKQTPKTRRSPSAAASSQVADKKMDAALEYKLNQDSELVIGLVGAVGTDLEAVTKILKDRLQSFEYKTEEIRISNHIISEVTGITHKDNFERIDKLMTAGNDLRKDTHDNAILVKAAAAKISQFRFKTHGSESPLKKQAFIISSLKHPEEVEALRQIYSNGFFLIGVYASEDRRMEYLHKNKDISPEKVQVLIKRDVDESDKFGQHTRDTFHLSDFFINYNGDNDRFQYDLWRIVDLMFGSPFVTPTFDEFAMFMAFSASLRSADLSRQVGAVVTRDNSIVGTGANDVPKAGGGQYWPQLDAKEKKMVDHIGGRDYTLGENPRDPNVAEREAIIEDILKSIPSDQQESIRAALNGSKLRNLTEYGRVVHAEMDALLSCARASIGTRDTDLYCTTFPCHNCAKHIISAGVKRVVYVEPYPKSKALDFHEDAITLSMESPRNKVIFEPFVGVGPRSFFNLFSTNLGSGYPIRRKDSNGYATKWDSHNSHLRMQMLPTSYIERETDAAAEVKAKLENRNGN